MASSIIRGAIHGMVPSLTETVSGTSSINSQAGILETHHHHHHGSANSRHNSSSSTRHMTEHVRSRSDASSRHHSRQSSAVEVDLNFDTEQIPPPTPASQESNNGNNGRAESGMEFLGSITWVERALPFVLLLLIRVLWDHRLGIIIHTVVSK